MCKWFLSECLCLDTGYLCHLVYLYSSASLVLLSNMPGHAWRREPSPFGDRSAIREPPPWRWKERVLLKWSNWIISSWMKHFCCFSSKTLFDCFKWSSYLPEVLLMAEIRRSPPGMYKTLYTNSGINMDKLSILTGERRISEPSTT